MLTSTSSGEAGHQSPISTPARNRHNRHFLRTPNSSTKLFISTKTPKNHDQSLFLPQSEYIQTTMSIINSNSSLTLSQKKSLIENVHSSYQNFLHELELIVKKLKNDLPTSCQKMKIYDFIHLSSSFDNNKSISSTPKRKKDPPAAAPAPSSLQSTPSKNHHLLATPKHQNHYSESLFTPSRMTRSMTKNMDEQSRISYEKQLNSLREQISTPSRRRPQSQTHISNLATPKLYPKLPKTPRTSSNSFIVRSSSIQLTPSRKRNENSLLSGHLNLQLDDGSLFDVDLSESPQKLRERILLSSSSAKKKKRNIDDGDGDQYNISNNDINTNNSIKDMKDKMQAYASQLSSFFSRLKE